LPVLEYLLDLRLQKTELAVVICNMLIARSIVRRSDEARFRDVFVVEERREFGGDDLVRDPKGSADAGAHQPVETVDTPPKSPPQISYPLPATPLPSINSQGPLLTFRRFAIGDVSRNHPTCDSFLLANAIKPGAILVVQP
jgi:hypothetical protein